MESRRPRPTTMCSTLLVNSSRRDLSSEPVMRRLFRRLRAAPLAMAAAAALTLAWLALRGPRPAKAVLFFVTRRRWLLSPAGTASPERIAAVVGFVADRHPLRPRCFER